MLTPEQVESYKENGFLRVHKIFSRKEVGDLREDLDFLINSGWTHTDQGWTGDWRVHYYGAEREKQIKLTSLHDLHFYSSRWMGAVTNPSLAEVISDLVGPNVELHHTTLHHKPPKDGMLFPMHQDSPFYRHENLDGYVDAIIHLDDTTSKNGALRFVPGSNKSGHIDHVARTKEGLECTPYLPLDQWPLEESVPVFAKAGDVVLFSIYTVHGSDTNLTDKWRRLVRVGYRDPANRQLEGQAFGRMGPIVKGLRNSGVNWYQ